MKPILFNTEMVRAILDGRKTVTRRPIKPQPEGCPVPMAKDSCWPGYFAIQGTEKVVRPSYQPGDILWVRETWNCLPIPEPLRGTSKTYWYKADGAGSKDKWRSPYHMPREAARIFLRVTAVRAERLGWMEKEDVLREGVRPKYDAGGCSCEWESEGCREKPCPNREGYITFCHLIPFWKVWDSTMKAEDRETYGWDANPWVWVIEFERISKEEATDGT